LKVITEAYPAGSGRKLARRIAFDSSHKYLAVAFEGDADYLGAREVLLPTRDPGEGHLALAPSASSSGYGTSLG
jgi:hypothetical protein